MSEISEQLLKAAKTLLEGQGWTVYEPRKVTSYMGYCEGDYIRFKVKPDDIKGVNRFKIDSIEGCLNTPFISFSNSYVFCGPTY